MYWGSRRNSSFVRTIARTIPSAAAASSNSTAFHLRIALLMDLLLSAAAEKIEVRARRAEDKCPGPRRVVHLVSSRKNASPIFKNGLTA